MRMLLDTHAFLWFIAGSESLSKRARRLIQEADNEILVSMATLWEISIKTSLNKLELAEAFDVLIPRELADNEFTQMPIALNHIVWLGRLPYLHRDPFDRLLIAQSLCEGVPLVSRDGKFDQYGIERIW